jgi:hypothetical protein
VCWAGAALMLCRAAVPRYAGDVHAHVSRRALSR